MTPAEHSLVKFDLLRNRSDPFSIETGITVLFCLRGHTTIFTADRSSVLRTGDMAAVSPMQLYSIRGSRQSAVLKVLIHPSVLRLTETDNAGILNCRIESVDDSRRAVKIRQLLAGLFRVSVNHEKESEMRAPVMELVLLLYEGYAERTDDMQKYSMRNLKLIDAVLSEVKTRWKQPLSLKEIAAQQFVSVSYLTRCFKKYTNYSFHDCLTEVRMSHAVEDLRYTEKSVTEIAFDNGFSNVNSFIAYFRKKYSLTPGTWRKEFRDAGLAPDSRMNPQPQDGIMNALLKYDTEHRAEQKTRVLHESVTVLEGVPVRPAWKEILNAGYAHEVLLSPIQKQIRRAQKEIGFTYLRVKGILDDDLFVCSSGNRDGSLQISFLYLDQLTDFILSEGLRPMLEFSWTPSAIARTEFRFFNARSSVMAPPKDDALWEKLIAELVRHWTLRYGVEEVAKWRFTLPMINILQLFPDIWSYDDYLLMYLAARRAVKSVSGTYRIGGFGFYTDLIMREAFGLRFLRDLKSRDALPDFLTLQCQSHDIAVPDRDFYIFTADQTYSPSTVSADVDFVSHFLKNLSSLLAREGLSGLPVFFEEWTCTLWQRDLSGDTIFRAAWLCKNILENRNALTGAGYWLLTDWLTEWKEERALFHGGYGLLTQHGVPKAGYRLLQMLNRLGDHCIGSGDGWYVSRSGDILTVVFYHYCHYEELYRLRYKRLEDPRQAYDAFQNPGKVRFELDLSGLPSGTYMIQEEALTRNSGSSFDEWLRMGAPKEMKALQTEWLDQISVPAIRQFYREIDRTLPLRTELEPNEIKMYTITKM